MDIQFDPKKFCFDDEMNHGRWGRSVRLIYPSEISALIPPLTYRSFWEHMVKLSPSLQVLGQMAGFSDEISQKVLGIHQRRLTLRAVLFGLSAVLLYFAFVGVIALVFVGLIGLVDMTDSQTEPQRWVGVVVVGLSVIILLLYIIGLMSFAKIFIKLVGVLIDRRFADTLCVATVLYLRFDLVRDHVLKIPHHRTVILNRFRGLANWTLLLSLRYRGSSSGIQEKAARHFQMLERYVRDREHWAIVPAEHTLADLRKDMMDLAPIYLTQEFGRFSWNPTDAASPIEQPPRRTRVAHTIGRIAAFTLPLLIMWCLLRYAEQLHIDKEAGKILPFVFIAWLLLTLDSALRLGVLAGVVNLAKGIKELK